MTQDANETESTPCLLSVFCLGGYPLVPTLPPTYLDCVAALIQDMEKAKAYAHCCC